MSGAVVGWLAQRFIPLAAGAGNPFRLIAARADPAALNIAINRSPERLRRLWRDAFAVPN